VPTLRKLQEDEVQVLAHKGTGIRAIIAMQYDEYLADFEANDYGEVLLGENENRLTVRNRLKAAAERRGWILRFIRTTDPIIRFKVISENGEQAIDVFGQAHEESEMELEEIEVAA
jgi:hypothetical protein